VRVVPPSPSDNTASASENILSEQINDKKAKGNRRKNYVQNVENQVSSPRKKKPEKKDEIALRVRLQN
jgi:hypothetical protein